MACSERWPWRSLRGERSTVVELGEELLEEVEDDVALLLGLPALGELALDGRREAQEVRLLLAAALGDYVERLLLGLSLLARLHHLL